MTDMVRCNEASYRRPRSLALSVTPPSHTYVCDLELLLPTRANAWTEEALQNQTGTLVEDGEPGLVAGAASRWERGRCGAR